MKPRRVLLAAAAAPLALAGLCAAWVAWPLPGDLVRPPGSPGFTLEDRRGLPLRAMRAGDGSRRRWVPLGEMDPDLLAAFVAAEDRRFHTHHGVDLTGAARAARENLRAGRVVSGASTITMQLARLAHPAGLPRSWAGKARQALWALRLERHLGKQAVLEHYLNRVPLGQGTVGVDAAAELYFGASARDLSLGEAALLAGLARAPAGGNPLVAPGRARLRRAEVLRALGRQGYADAAALRRAGEEPVLAARTGGAPFLAPHFTSRVVSWLDHAGPARRPAGTWRTSLDAELQLALEGEVRHTVALLRNQGVRQAALVVLDNPTGEILAWIGSPDFWADTAGQVDMVASPRQPGSALKPFLYGLAFDRGRTPATIIADVARVYRTGTGPYRPRNYDRTEHGPVRAREALASSYNIPAVELAEQLGASALLRTLHDAGFASLARPADHYGLGLALGNGDVTLLELANGYRALAAGGVWSPTRWWHAAEDRHGAGGTRRVMSARSAALVLDVLDDPAARVPGFGLDSPLELPFPVAAKTGTSRHFTDNWAVGATGRFTVAVWVGNFDGRPMDGVSGVTGAGPLLHRALLATARRYDPGTLPTPGELGAEAAAICRVSGLRAGARCPRTTEWFAPGTAPADGCDWHDEAGGVRWPAEFAEWAERSGRSRTAADGIPDQGAARASAAAGTGPAASALRIVAPRHGDLYRLPPGVDPRYATIALRTAGAGPGVRWSVNGRAVAGRWPLARGEHLVLATRGAERDSVRIRVE